MEVEAETDPIIISPSLDDTTTATGGEAKACADCHTTKTPLWRGGPEGPKSLCNACGIRYRKRRRQALGLEANAEAQDQQQKKKATATAAASSKEDKKEEGDKKEEEGDKKKDEGDKKKEKQVTVELRVVSFGKEVMLKQRRRMRRKKCLSEEERAAVLLMALSSGVIYAS
ncbi:hypothetical protein PR202_gb03585 [Eleusine coracana subsp. coracana]|uniref:GATA-type domain-containing protein n=1 Tax=Eleusine coracana subsp. coracana TaxID=191504 RepID=A0AAV5E1I7_ELECO|nr:hypothetical protein QOZ80_1BG0098340 [Eleusine coracana subsp. coracana]GJN16582.1 hypothetical protein PR202_gb03585 [Eleusine coracana subsp. coracana]